MTDRAGQRNDLTDVEGIRVGHHHRIGRGWLTGTTVVLTSPGTVGGVDVRGGAPGTRETDLLDPRNLVEEVHAVCLSGGSAYGLAAADGVLRWLAERAVGYRVGEEAHHVVPIVPAAVLFDLGVGATFTHRPDEAFGRAAAAGASRRRVPQGCVGAGAGAHAGGLKGGIGSASTVLATGITVAALVAVNPSGTPFDPLTGELYGARVGVTGEFGELRRPSRMDLRAWRAEQVASNPLNTTLGVVATDARLAKPECARLAGAGQDGLARAIRPIHQMTDGDTVFALATGTRELPDDRLDGRIQPPTSRPLQLNLILAAAADVVARSVAHAMVAAKSMGGYRSYLDQFPSARRKR